MNFWVLFVVLLKIMDFTRVVFGFSKFLVCILGQFLFVYFGDDCKIVSRL